MSTSGLVAWLDMAFAAEPAGAFIEVRWRLPDRPGMGQLWQPVERREAAIDSIRSIGAKTDCYVGVAPRAWREGGRDAVLRIHVFWADADSAEAIKALERFDPPPNMVICSGSGRHAYWALWPPLEPAWAEKGNRRLAHALGADPRAVDAARILRPPGTFNHKTGEPRPVELERMTGEVYEARAIVEGLPDPPAPRRRERPPAARPSSDDPLLAIPPPVWAEALTSAVVGRDGKIRCPLHEDRTPSMHVYDEADRGVWCFGCEQGGDIYTFAGLLWGLERRGGDFLEIRRRLEAELLPALRRAAA